MLHYRGLKDFIYMLTERHKSEVAHMKVLKDIHDLNFAVTTFQSLYEGIKGFKNDMLNQYNYSKEFSDGIKDECIDPLYRLAESLIDRIGKQNQYMKTIEKNYLNSVNKLQNAKEKFYEAAKIAEIFKIKCEANKNNNTLTNEQKTKDEIKSQEALKNAKNCENLYINSVNYANNIQDNYIESKKCYLNYIQDLEEELAENIKIVLRKYIIFQIAFARNMQYDMDKKAKLMEDIDIRQDIKKLIFKRTTKDLPPQKFVFVPYSSKFENIDLSTLEKNPEIQKILGSKTILSGNNNNSVNNNNIVSNVRSFISGVFFNEAPSIETIDLSESKTLNEIEVIITGIFDGKELPYEICNSLSNYILNKKTRRFLLQKMENKRLKGVSNINDKSYNIIGDIFIEILDTLKKIQQRDFESIKYIVNLSSSLYKIKDSQKIFLQNYLINNTIWKNFHFWIDFIKFCIIEEMHNQKNNNVYNYDETLEEKNDRISKIVYGQVNYFIYFMISLKINPEVMKKAVDYFSEYYNLNKEYIEQNMKLIEEYELKINQSEKNITNESKLSDTQTNDTNKKI